MKKTTLTIILLAILINLTSCNKKTTKLTSDSNQILIDSLMTVMKSESLYPEDFTYKIIQSDTLTTESILNKYKTGYLENKGWHHRKDFLEMAQLSMEDYKAEATASDRKIVTYLIKCVVRTNDSSKDFKSIALSISRGKGEKTWFGMDVVNNDFVYFDPAMKAIQAQLTDDANARTAAKRADESNN